MNYVLTQKHLNPPFEISNFVQIGYKSMRKLICYKVPFNMLVPNCLILYSEDMQHSQVIEDNLKIINPFQMECG